MDYLISSALVTVFTLIGIYVWWRRKVNLYWEKRGVPHDKSFNCLSFIYKFTTQPIHEVLLESYKKHGRIYGGFEMRLPVLTVCEPDLLRDILVKDFHAFNFRREFDVGDKVLSKIIVGLKGDDWKRVRTIITPAFTSRRMRQMSRIMNECANRVVETLGEYVDRREPADCKRIFGAFSLDVIASSAFATKIDSLNDPENIFVKQLQTSFIKPPILQLLAFFALPAWITRHFQLATPPSTNFFRDVVLEVIKERKETGKKYDDMLQLLLDAQEDLGNETTKDAADSGIQDDETDQYGSVTNSEMMPRLKNRKLSEDELVAQCVLFFFVGYETTAATLSYIAYCLALNPECQQKLIAEVDEAFERHKEWNYDVIRDMKYLDCVLSETLRMYPALTRSERTACEDYKLGNTGITIEKGTLVGFNIHAMHHDPEFFSNPETFDPERFMSENVNHPQYAYLPFGAGPRNCLGMRFAVMEIKLCMCHVIRNFKFKKAPTTKIPLTFKVGQQFLSIDELPLSLERRNIKETEK